MRILCLFLGVAFAQSLFAADCTWVGLTATLDDTPTATELNDCITVAGTKTGAVIIEIPDATTTFSGTVTVNMSSGWANVTGLTIKGQNDCSTTANASPSFNYPTSCGTNITNFVLSYTGTSDKDFRLSQVEIEGASGVNIKGTGKTWRFDNLYWNTVTGATSNRIFWLSKNASAETHNGLIDHCYFKNWQPGVGGEILFIYDNVYGGNYEWINALNLGTSDAVYVENNKIETSTGGAYMTDNHGSLKYVFRYNHITNGHFAGHDFTAAGAEYRAQRKQEVYENVFLYNASGNNYVAYRSFVNGVFYNNTITASPVLGNTILLQLWRSDCAVGSGKSYLADPDNYPHSCSSGTGCIDIDGTGSGGYPCRDQPGVSGNNPQVGGGSPFLLWGNTYNGGSITVTGDSYVQANRDYCLTDSSTMPATCNGVSTTYSAYTYPHPLIAGTTPSQTKSGVTIGELRIDND